MANNINEKQLNELSNVSKGFLDYVEESTKLKLEGHIILTAREDAVQLVFSKEDKLHDAPLNTMPIIILKKIDGLFEPVFNFMGDYSAREGALLFSKYLKHSSTVEEDDEEDEVVAEEPVTKEPVAEEKTILVNGVGYPASFIQEFIDNQRIAGEELTFELFCAGARAEDILHPAPKIITTKDELSRVLHNFRRTYGCKSCSEVAKVMSVSTSQMLSYFKKEFYPTHRKTIAALEKWLGASIRKEVK